MAEWRVEVPAGIEQSVQGLEIRASGVPLSKPFMEMVVVGGSAFACGSTQEIWCGGGTASRGYHTAKVGGRHEGPSSAGGPASS